jgi:hypothetical protein
MAKMLQTAWADARPQGTPPSPIASMIEGALMLSNWCARGGHVEILKLYRNRRRVRRAQCVNLSIVHDMMCAIAKIFGSAEKTSVVRHKRMHPKWGAAAFTTIPIKCRGVRM